MSVTEQSPAPGSPVGAAEVAVVLVSHDGARWLPAVIEGIRTQESSPVRVVAVDTGSRDESAELLAAAFGEVVRLPGSTTFPAALQAGLDQLTSAGASAEWIWVLHDDANPDPGALRELLAAAAAHPEADVLGPKLREWPSLRRLLELGVTISGTGRRETGLERGEYDQGQHDDVRRVLAVNTAGMLVRRSVLEELGGLDPQLPLFGNDLDFGWRAAAAGHTTLVVPQAVVFHAEAAHRGVRRTPLTGRHTHYQERRAALFTLLANGPAASLPFMVVRLALGTLVRMIGFLLVRSVGEALDDLAALLSVYSGPREILAARRARRGAQSAAPADVRPLLAPRWLPYRHGLDFVSDLLVAVTDQASDVAERRRAAAAEHDPASFAARRQVVEEEDGAYADTGVVARFLTNPVAVLLALFVFVALVGARAAYGPVSGGGLSPVPDSVGDWWSLHLRSWHPLGAQGTAVPAPGYLLPLALLGSVLGTTLTVTALLALAVPVGLWGAWRFLRVAGRLVSPRGAPRWLILWGATTYSLLPVVSGAWGDGRLAPVVAGALLPWLAHAALGFADPEADRRWRAAWRTALLLAVVTAFAPAAWLLALVLGLVVVAAAFAIIPTAMRDRSTWAPPAGAVAVVPVLLAPWWVGDLVHRASEGLLLDAGRLPSPRLDGLDLLTGRLGDLGAWWWLGLVAPALALLALLPRATRIPVQVCWVVALMATALAALLDTVQLDLAALSTAAGTTFLQLVLQGAFVIAAVLGAQGALLGGVAAWRRPVAVVLALAAAAVPLGGLGWFVLAGGDRLGEGADTGIPAYMVQSSMQGPEHGILVVRGSVADGLTYTVRRGDGVTLGEDEILALSTADRGLTDRVRELASQPTPSVVDDLARSGIEYVVLPAPADGDVAASLDATGGLAQASAEDRSTRAWQISRRLDPDAVDGPGSWLHAVLLLVQAVAIVWVAVLCAPTTNRRRKP